MTKAEAALLALRDLAATVRTVNGYLTDAGARVEMSPFFSEMGDDEYLTLVYESSDLALDGKDLDGAMRSYQMEAVYHIDAHVRPDAGREAQQYARLKGDMRRLVLSLVGSRLRYDGAEIGSARYRGAALIPEARDAGVIGVRTTVAVRYTETVTH